MTTTSERVAMLEERSAEQVAATAALRVDVQQLGRDVAELRGEVSELRGSVAELRESITELRRDMDRRFERLEDKFDRRFTWLVGTQIAMLIAVVGALAAPHFQ